METALLMIYPLLIFVIAFRGAGLSPKGEFAPDFLSLKQSKIIQATACLLVIIHHVTQQITRYGSVLKGPITIFNYIGFLFTALFFFYSGYGLLTSFLTKEDYLKGFLIKRLSAVLIPFWIINIVGMVIAWIAEGPSTEFYRNTGGLSRGIIDVLEYVLGIRMVNDNGWFIIEVVIFYLLFYAFFSMIKNKDFALILMCISVAAIIAYSFFQGHNIEGQKAHWFRGEWWFNSSHTFVFGMLVARFREEITGFVKRHFRAFLISFAILTVVAIAGSCLVQEILGYYHEYLPTYRRDAAITLLVQALTCIAWTVLVLLVSMKITLNGRVILYISGIQLEIFLIHGIFARNVFGNMEMSDFVRFAVVLASGIISAAVLAVPIDFLVRKVSALAVTDRRINDTLEARAAEEIRQKRQLRSRRILAVGIVGAFVLILGVTLGRRFYDEGLCKKEIEEIRNAGAGDVVTFGRFDTDPGRPGRERLTWIVARQKDTEICLVCEKGIAGSYYNQKHEKVKWGDSDLHELLGTELFTGIFSEAETKYILPSGQDMITLLSPTEAEEIFGSDKERELAITDAAERYGTNINRPSKANNWDMKNYRSSWWWLKSSSALPADTAPIVTVDGEILLNTQEVNRPGGAIRPVVWVKVQ
jgi:membrane-bound acyltransferase YfiQ involved in biofilm formation